MAFLCGRYFFYNGALKHRCHILFLISSKCKQISSGNYRFSDDFRGKEIDQFGQICLVWEAKFEHEPLLLVS